MLRNKTNYNSIKQNKTQFSKLIIFILMLYVIHGSCSSMKYKTNMFQERQNDTDNSNIDELARQAWDISDQDIRPILEEGIPRTTSWIPTSIRHAQDRSKKISEYIILSESSNAIDVIKLYPTNIAKYATMAVISCNFIIAKEEDLQLIFKDVFYNSIVDFISSHEFNEGIKTIEGEVEKEVSDLYNSMSTLKEVRDLYDKINKNYSILTNPSETPEGYCKKILYNKQYMQAVAAYCLGKLEPKVIEYAQSKNYALIRQQKKEARTTHFFIGPPGAGKSTIIALKSQAAGYSMDWNNQVKINTDTYRALVIDSRLVTENVELQHLLNYEEAAYISRLSKQLYDNKINKHIAPNILIDAAFLSSREVEKGLKKGGHVNINIVTSPMKSCLVRAFLRGQSEQRYVTKDYIIGSCKFAANYIEQIVQKYIGKNIKYYIYSNDVPKGEPPILIEKGNLGKRTIKVFREDLLKEFLKEQKLNPNAKTLDELYLQDNFSEQPGHPAEGLNQFTIKRLPIPTIG